MSLYNVFGEVFRVLNVNLNVVYKCSLVVLTSLYQSDRCKPRIETESVYAFTVCKVRIEMLNRDNFPIEIETE